MFCGALQEGLCLNLFHNKQIAPGVLPSMSDHPTQNSSVEGPIFFAFFDQYPTELFSFLQQVQHPFHQNQKHLPAKKDLSLVSSVVNVGLYTFDPGQPEMQSRKPQLAFSFNIYAWNHLCLSPTVPASPSPLIILRRSKATGRDSVFCSCSGTHFFCVAFHCQRRQNTSWNDVSLFSKFPTNFSEELGVPCIQHQKARDQQRKDLLTLIRSCSGFLILMFLLFSPIQDKRSDLILLSSSKTDLHTRFLYPHHGNHDKPRSDHLQVRHAIRMC